MICGWESIFFILARAPSRERKLSWLDAQRRHRGIAQQAAQRIVLRVVADMAVTGRPHFTLHPTHRHTHPRLEVLGVA